MKLYNYWIEFESKSGKGEHRIDHERKSWKPSKELAEKALKEDLAWCRQNEETRHSIVRTVNYGIEEKEIEEAIVLEGILGDNGCSYEDFQMTIGDKLLVEELYKKYAGNNVRLTLEILEPEVVVPESFDFKVAERLAPEDILYNAEMFKDGYTYRITWEDDGGKPAYYDAEDVRNNIFNGDWIIQYVI